MTLQECKEQIARESGLNLDRSRDSDTFNSSDYYAELIAKLYASEKVKEALKVADERAELIYHCGKTKNETSHKHIAIGHNHIRPNRGKILSLETELLTLINKEI